jgi:hypothetical protein
MKYELQKTTNYGLFELHDCNRPKTEDKMLLESMKRYGFMPSGAIHVRKVGNKLKIIRGHHRFFYAQRLGLPIYYIIDDTDADIFYLEGSFHPVWDGDDFVYARSHSGDKDCTKLKLFQQEHHLHLGAAASLVGGQSAGSGNKTKQVKNGTFTVGDMTHANQVVRVTDLCRELGIVFATSSGFVKAVSAALRIPEFSLEGFIAKIRLYPRMMNRRSTGKEFLEEIESIYNYAAKGKRMPVSFRAQEVARQRAVTFGEHNQKN